MVVIRYVANRLLFALLTLFFIATLTFFLMNAVPGGPFTGEKTVPPEILRQLEEHYGLDKPLLARYADYLVHLATWNLGPSIKERHTTVNEIIGRGFPVSLALGLQAAFIAVFGGITLGTVAALFRGRWQDHLVLILSVLGLSVPGFLIATFFQFLFGLEWRWFPIAGWDSWRHAVLPAMALAALPFAFITRLVRASMIEVMAQDYIKTARAKGIDTLPLIFRHGLRNALLPVVTYLGPLIANVVTGSFVIERIFGIPGLGREFVSSVSNRDYTVIMGTTMFYSLLLVLLVVVVDIVYKLVDPRIQLSDANK